jgi:hypothetical protein
VEHRPQLPEVQPGVEGRAWAELLRRHVFGRADDVAGGRRAFGHELGDAEIEQLDLFGGVPGPHHHHVGRLEVTVQDALVVGHRDAGRHLFGEPHRPRRSERRGVSARGHQRREVDTVDELEQEVELAAVGQRPHRVAAGDVGMVDLLEHQRLVDETLADPGVRRPLAVEDLERAAQTAHDRLDLVDDAETAGPEATQDAVLLPDDRGPQAFVARPASFGPLAAALRAGLLLLVGQRETGGAEVLQQPCRHRAVGCFEHANTGSSGARAGISRGSGSSS